MASVETRADSPRTFPKCRIPQRLPQNRPCRGRQGSANDPPSRPRSGKKDEGQVKYPAVRGRGEKVTPLKKSTIPKKINNVYTSNKMGKGVITVPVVQKSAGKSAKSLLNQDIIKRHEDLETKQSDRDPSPSYCSAPEYGSVVTKKSQLKLKWNEHIKQLDKMKKELSDRQIAIMNVYTSMRNTHKQLLSVGHKIAMPDTEDLKIMNVAKLTAEQLLQLCAGAPSDKQGNEAGNQLSVDPTKLYSMPTKLVSTCEQTLMKRKEIIDWFTSILENCKQSGEEKKGISMSKLSNKIKEFNAENEMLQRSLEHVKGEFLEELNEIVDYLRRGVNETMVLQLKTEELTYRVSELNSQNCDLKKQIHNADHFRPHVNKARLEELEKELKDERAKKNTMKDRLTRAEGQIKIGIERAGQLEAALEQSRSQTWRLERTIQQLHDQNKKLEEDFNKELNKLTDSIRENTVHLEEIAHAREKLQSEKNELEKRLNDLSLTYNDTLKDLKSELQNTVSQLAETEKKYENEVELRKKGETKLESLCAQLVEAQLKQKDISQLMQDQQSLLETKAAEKTVLEVQIKAFKSEIEEFKNKLLKKTEAVRDIELNLKEKEEKFSSLEKSLKVDISNKNEYINELEKKQSLLEEQLQENEDKMSSYEKQLNTLKNHIAQLQEDFGQFENMDELRDLVSKQRTKLFDTTRHNETLLEAIQRKENELEHRNGHILELERQLEQRDELMKLLSDKEEEHTNIIKLLRNNLEMRAQADKELTNQLIEKNTEIETLVANVDTRKQQIAQLEKVIISLEEQTLKAKSQRMEDQNQIKQLVQKIAEYEFHVDSKRNIEPAENLDNLIKILEEELEAPFEASISCAEESTLCRKKQDRNKRDKIEKVYREETYYCDEEAIPTKIVTGNFIKQTFIPSIDDQFKGDNLDRKKAITNMEKQKWITTADSGVYSNLLVDKDSNYMKRSSPLLKDFTKNLQYVPNHVRDEKKIKMFKIAGHRL